MVTKLEKNQMMNIFREISLYYNSPYLSYSAEDLSIVISMYYNSLKYYEEKHIRRRLQRYIEKEKFFPKVCDLIPQEVDFYER